MTVIDSTLGRYAELTISSHKEAKNIQFET